VEPAVVSKRKRAEVNYYEGEYHDLPVPVPVIAPKPKPVVKPVAKPVDNTFLYIIPSAAKHVVKPAVKTVKPHREEINLIDDEEDKPVPVKPFRHSQLPTHYDKNFEL